MASETATTTPPTATTPAAPGGSSAATEQAAATATPATATATATPAAGAVPPAGVVPPQPAPATSASLYVGDLAQEVTEAMLFEKFNAIGPVASIRVCRDAITRRSLGYAYVNFVNPNDAETAINDMNYDPVAGRPCRIMWSQRDPSVRRSGVGNIFIKNLDKTIGQKELYDTFIAFGSIISCKVVVDQEGNSRGFGFIHYELQADADSAIEKVNGKRLRDSTVFVGPFRSKSERLEEISKMETEYTNLYIKNLPEDTDEEALVKMFEKFGTITSSKIATQKEGESAEKSRGFGWVSFSNPEEARKAVEELNDKEMDDGKKLFVGRAQKKAERLAQLRSQYEKKRSDNQLRYKGVNLYVKNLDDTITDDMLRKAFEEFGTITSAKVMKDDKEGSKGFGFVCFNSADEATKAVTEMNGKILEKKPLYVALAQRKEERRQQIAMQHNQRLQSMRMQQGQYMGQGMVPPQGAGMMYMPAQMQVPRGAYPYPQAGMPRPGAQFMRAQQQQMQMQPQGPYRMQQQPNMPGQPQAGARMPGGARNQNPRQAKGGRGQFRQPNGRNMPNMPMQGGAMPQQMPPQPALIQQGQEPLTASALASASNAEQKQMLGERLFPLIQSTHQDQAGKITGMLLEMDNSELLHLLEDQNALSAKVNEAVKVLSDHAQEQARKGGAQ